MSVLISAFLIGLVGSVHCVGMCGGFVLALSQTHAGTPGRHVHQVLYFLGKTATYAVLGALAGVFGGVVGEVAGVQRGLSLGVGVVLVAIGLGLLGVWRRFGSGRLTGMLGRFSQVLGRSLRRRTFGATFGLGMANGLLPCGLVYAALAVAASTGEGLHGALAMGAFGLATIPALYVLGWAGFLVRPSWRVRLNRFGGVFVILLGLFTLIRGTAAFDQMLHGSHGAVHEQHAPAPGLPDTTQHEGHH